MEGPARILLNNHQYTSRATTNSPADDLQNKRFHYYVLEIIVAIVSIPFLFQIIQY